jgi:hypothetical protein
LQTHLATLLLTFDALVQVNIRGEDIVDGNPKLTLGLIWTIILHFQVGEPCFPGAHFTVLYFYNFRGIFLEISRENEFSKLFSQKISIFYAFLEENNFH